MNLLSRIIPGISLSILLTTSICQAMQEEEESSLSVLPTDPNVRVMGRTQVADNDSITLGFPGQELLIVFKGDYVAMKGAAFTGTQIYFNISLDGQELPKVELTNGDFMVTLLDELDPDEKHTLRLVRRNESWQGVVRIDQFDLGEHGDLYLSPNLPKRKLLCIGDSITCGQATEQIPPNIEPGNQNANAELAYGWQLAKRLNAQVNLVSYGGRGLMRTWDGKTDDINAPDFFERALPDDPDSIWDHTSNQPDIVTICLGQNDFNQGIIPSDQYVPAYISFVDRIHEVYPDAKLILISSPMHGFDKDTGEPASDRVALEADLKAVVAHFEQQGSPEIRFHSIGWYPGTQYNAHPTGPQHTGMADELEPIIRDLMDW